MSPSLQKILTELDQLALEEQWQVLGHLIQHLQHRAVIVAKPDPSSDLATDPDLATDQWDQQIVRDWEAGKLASLVAKAEADIAANQVRSLDAVLHNV